MKKIKKRISNPMTIVAIFATLSEASAAVSLPFLDNDEREIYVWFLISFPFYLLFLFFVTLNFNYRSLYAPSDFDKDEHFIKVIDNTESSAGAPTKVRRFRPWLRSTQDPPGIAPQHTVYLPGPVQRLSLIDTRGMSTPADFTTLMEKTRKPRQVIVFLVCAESAQLLKEGTPKSSRHKKKEADDTFCIVYDLNSQDVTLLDHMQDE